MSIMRYELFLAVAVAAVLTPGPAMLAILGQAVARGARATMPVVLGNVAGAMVLMAASIAGLAALLAAMPGALLAVRIAGAVVLGWLGWKAWRAGGEPTASVVEGGFGRGLLIALSNPKALLFYAAVLPQFVDAARPAAPQFAVLAGTFAGLELVVTTAVTFGANALPPPWRRPALATRVQRVSGLVMLTAAVILAFA